MNAVTEQNDRMVLWAIRDMTGSTTLPAISALSAGMHLHFVDEPLSAISLAAQEALRLVTSLISNDRSGRPSGWSGW